MERIRYTGEIPEKEITQIFNETMEEMLKSDPKVVYLDADLMGSLKTSSLWKKYPKQVFNTGIQEANMVGVAAGLYLAGFTPFIHSFTPFATRRVFDQLFISVAYAHKSIRVIGSDVGIAATFNGGTHMCFEDVAMIRTVPDACIIDVSDGVMFSKLLKESKNYTGLCYFRTARRGVSDIYCASEEFEIGKGKILIDGIDVTIIATGLQVSQALEAARLLKDQGVSARVIDIVTIKPLDIKLIIESARKTGAIVTTENHNVEGGLGDAVASAVAAAYPVPVLKNGVMDTFGQVGGEPFLREQFKMRSCDIAELAYKAIQMKNSIGKE